MTSGADGPLRLLVVAGERACALDLTHVVETMRALPVVAIGGAPTFLLGVAVVRGVATPVVDLAAVLDGALRSAVRAKFVVLRLGERLVSLSVDRVIGVQQLGAEVVRDLPPLLRAADANAIAAIGLLDAELLFVLRASRLVRDETWRVFDSLGAGG